MKIKQKNCSSDLNQRNSSNAPEKQAATLCYGDFGEGSAQNGFTSFLSMSVTLFICDIAVYMLY